MKVRKTTTLRQLLGKTKFGLEGLVYYPLVIAIVFFVLIYACLIALSGRGSFSFVAPGVDKERGEE